MTSTNNELKNATIDRYVSTSGADKFALFHRKGNAWYYIIADVNADVMTAAFRSGHKSVKRGGGYLLRFQPDFKQWARLAKMCGGERVLCSVDHANAARAYLGVSKGCALESIFADVIGGTWDATDAPYWVCGDVNKDGVEYQCKADGASIAESATFSALRALHK